MGLAALGIAAFSAMTHARDGDKKVSKTKKAKPAKLKVAKA
jgi:hypothetical protein